MVDFPAFRQDINEEISSILATDFNIAVTKTLFVPHSDDQAITFPNLDDKNQGTKIIETTVLYVDMRRSTELNLKHRSQTVAKLYSAFVRAMARCAGVYGGEVRGIIGDRVMILFDCVDCFVNAVNTAILINSVCRYVINKHFKHNEVVFGIGIDHGSMLATKTGVRRHGSAQQSYRSLVWLGRPANIASKLTDKANKEAEKVTIDKIQVAFRNGLLGFRYEEYFAWDFAKQFSFNSTTGQMHHFRPDFHSFQVVPREVPISGATKPILMTKAVFDGFQMARPGAPEIRNSWFELCDVTVPGYSGQVYGGDVIFTIFKQQ